METESYSVGSIADLISGKKTPNKPKVVQKEFKKPEQQIAPEKLYVPREPKQNINKSEAKSPGNVKSKMFKSKQKKKTEFTPSSSLGKKRKRDENADNQEMEPPKKRQNNGVNGEKRIKMKENEEIERAYGDRTLFVGNVPIQMSKLKLRKFFSKYGNVEAVRVRGVPVADIRVPKKVAYIRKEFHPDRTSANCYVRFATPEEAQKALVLNGQLLKDHHLRVTLCDADKKTDSSKSIFIGNVSFSAEEDDIWKLFEPCGKIESVRLVRDSKTGIGKGFGYVNFESSDSVELAMQMEKLVLKRRELRVSICKANAKNKKKRRANSTSKVKKEKKQKSGGEDVTQNEETLNVAAQKKNDDKTKKQGFEGIKISEKKKKKKVNKGLLQKKILVKKLLPKPKE